MAKNRDALSDFDQKSQPKEVEAPRPAKTETVKEDSNQLTEEEKRLYDRCFDTGILSLIGTCGNLGGITNKEVFVRSLLRQNFALCDMMIDEHRKYRNRHPRSED